MLKLLGWIFKFVIGITWELLFGQEPLPQMEPALPARPEDQISRESLKQGHEVGDARPMLVVYCAVGLFVTIFIIMGIAAWLQHELRYKYSQPAVTQYQLSFRHAPYAETSIARDWMKIDRETKQRLETYHWIDRKAGVVAIPIERAIQLIGAEGLPSRQGQPPPFPAPDQEMKALGETEKTHEITKSF